MNTNLDSSLLHFNWLTSNSYLSAQVGLSVEGKPLSFQPVREGGEGGWGLVGSLYGEVQVEQV